MVVLLWSIVHIPDIAPLKKIGLSPIGNQMSIAPELELELHIHLSLPMLGFCLAYTCALLCILSLLLGVHMCIYTIVYGNIVSLRPSSIPES